MSVAFSKNCHISFTVYPNHHIHLCFAATPSVWESKNIPSSFLISAKKILSFLRYHRPIEKHIYKTLSHTWKCFRKCLQQQRFYLFTMKFKLLSSGSPYLMPTDLVDKDSYSSLTHCWHADVNSCNNDTPGNDWALYTPYDPH